MKRSLLAIAAIVVMTMAGCASPESARLALDEPGSTPNAPPQEQCRAGLLDNPYITALAPGTKLRLVESMRKRGCPIKPEHAAAAAAEKAAQDEREAKYGPCIRDEWRSVSRIGKTTTSDVIRHAKACGGTILWDMSVSRHVSANRVQEFVHFGTYRTFYFTDGVLVSVSTY
jgi:hypothetical protein